MSVCSDYIGQRLTGDEVRAIFRTWCAKLNKTGAAVFRAHAINTGSEWGSVAKGELARVLAAEGFTLFDCSLHTLLLIFIRSAGQKATQEALFERLSERLKELSQEQTLPPERRQRLHRLLLEQLLSEEGHATRAHDNKTNDVHAQWQVVENIWREALTPMVPVAASSAVAPVASPVRAAVAAASASATSPVPRASAAAPLGERDPLRAHLQRGSSQQSSSDEEERAEGEHILGASARYRSPSIVMPNFEEEDSDGEQQPASALPEQSPNAFTDPRHEVLAVTDAAEVSAAVAATPLGERDPLCATLQRSSSQQSSSDEGPCQPPFILDTPVTRQTVSAVVSAALSAPSTPVPPIAPAPPSTIRHPMFHAPPTTGGPATRSMGAETAASLPVNASQSGTAPRPMSSGLMLPALPSSKKKEDEEKEEKKEEEAKPVVQQLFPPLSDGGSAAQALPADKHQFAARLCSFHLCSSSPHRPLAGLARDVALLQGLQLGHLRANHDMNSLRPLSREDALHALRHFFHDPQQRFDYFLVSFGGHANAAGHLFTMDGHVREHIIVAEILEQWHRARAQDYPLRHERAALFIMLDACYAGVAENMVKDHVRQHAGVGCCQRVLFQGAVSSGEESVDFVFTPTLAQHMLEARGLADVNSMGVADRLRAARCLPAEQYGSARDKRLQQMSAVAQSDGQEAKGLVWSKCTACASVVFKRNHCFACGALYCSDCTGWRIRGLRGDGSKETVKCCKECARVHGAPHRRALPAPLRPTLWISDALKQDGEKGQGFGLPGDASSLRFAYTLDEERVAYLAFVTAAACHKLWEGWMVAVASVQQVSVPLLSDRAALSLVSRPARAQPSSWSADAHILL